jgi:hypothetical protein
VFAHQKTQRAPSDIHEIYLWKENEKQNFTYTLLIVYHIIIITGTGYIKCMQYPLIVVAYNVRCVDNSSEHELGQYIYVKHHETASVYFVLTLLAIT